MNRISGPQLIGTCCGSPSWVQLPGTMTKCNGTLQYLPLKAEPSRPKQNDWIWLSDISGADSQNRILPQILNQKTCLPTQTKPPQNELHASRTSSWQWSRKLLRS